MFKKLTSKLKGTVKAKHKYVARIETGDSKNPYRYFYTNEEYRAYLDSKKAPDGEEKNGISEHLNDAKEKIDSTAQSVNEKKEKAVEVFNAVRSKVQDVLHDPIGEANKVYKKGMDFVWNEFDSNPYITDPTTYSTKIEKVKDTAEYKKFVAEGNTEYSDVDEYLYKKKHPGLDLISDVINGRDLSITKIDKDSVVAGIVDHAIVYAGYLAIANTVVSTGYKVRQGSYNDDLDRIATTINDQIDTVNQAKKMVETYDKVTNPTAHVDTKKAASEAAKIADKYGIDTNGNIPYTISALEYLERRGPEFDISANDLKKIRKLIEELEDGSNA